MKTRITYMLIILLLACAGKISAQQNNTQQATETQKDSFQVFVPSSFNQETEFDVRVSNPGNIDWKMDFTIYNRWGEIVWSSQDKYVHWDGKNMQHANLPADTYVFRMKIETSDGKKTDQTGYISLVR